MKKLFSKLTVLVVLVAMVFGLGLVNAKQAPAYAATSVYKPWGVGTYDDFGMQVRLDINPKYSNAAKFLVEYAPGYNATKGFKSFTIDDKTNYYSNKQYYVRTGFQATSMGWWTVRVISISLDGTKSAPFVTNVNVLR